MVMGRGNNRCVTKLHDSALGRCWLPVKGLAACQHRWYLARLNKRARISEWIWFGWRRVLSGFSGSLKCWFVAGWTMAA